MIVTLQHLNALSAIWQEYGSLRGSLPQGTALWHCGHIPNRAAIDDGRMLWTTCNSVKGSLYGPTALSAVPFLNAPAFKLALVALRDLNVADFASASLGDFTYRLCNAQHDGMKQALRAWCGANGFDGVVSINGDADEVAVVKPRTDLDVLNALAL